MKGGGRRVWALLGLVLLGIIGLPSESRPANDVRIDRDCEEVDQNKQCTLYGPSLIRLIALPEYYDGKRIRVIGYLHLEFEGNTLYVHKDDYTKGISKNGVWVDIDSAGFLKQAKGLLINDKYVIVEGTFSSVSTGHLGMNSGSIQGITRLDQWE